MKSSVKLEQGCVPDHCLRGYVESRTCGLLHLPQALRCQSRHSTDLTGLLGCCRGEQFSGRTLFSPVPQNFEATPPFFSSAPTAAAPCLCEHQGCLPLALRHQPLLILGRVGQPHSHDVNDIFYHFWAKCEHQHSCKIKGQSSPPLWYLKTAPWAPVKGTAFHAIWPTAFLGSSQSWNKA